MFKLYILFILTIVIFMQPVPAFCGATRTMTFQLSVTIPEHVIVNNNRESVPFSNNTNQLVQTQTVIRNNKTIRLTSIVVP